MSAFKFLAVIFILICLYSQETDASKEWIKERFNDGTRMITKRFNREGLVRFLQKGPKLWIEKAISKAQELMFQKSIGSIEPSDEEIASLVNNNRPNLTNMYNHADIALPASFDARTRWPNCPTIGEVIHQSECGSCWAVATTAVMQDRACIATNGKKKPRISAMDILECCEECKAAPPDGCQAGKRFSAFKYFQTQGIVSGGAFNSNYGCKPYIWDYPNSTVPYVSPQCSNQCKNGANYNKDKHYGGDIYALESGDEVGMKTHLYLFGPLTVGIEVFKDLMTYKSGIYYKKPDSGKSYGGHAVRLVGWAWGEGGFFRVVRGKNEINVEKLAIGSVYDEKKSRNAKS